MIFHLAQAFKTWQGSGRYRQASSLLNINDDFRLLNEIVHHQQNANISRRQF